MIDKARCNGDLFLLSWQSAERHMGVEILMLCLRLIVDAPTTFFDACCLDAMVLFDTELLH